MFLQQRSYPIPGSAVNNINKTVYHKLFRGGIVEKILDIGCGKNKVCGALGLDIDKSANPEILHDLNVYPYPIKDNEFDKIYAKHVIEHVNDPVLFLQECYRILKVGGTIFVETPHFSSRVAYSEPDHKRFFSYFMFSTLLSKTKFSKIRQKDNVL